MQDQSKSFDEIHLKNIINKQRKEKGVAKGRSQADLVKGKDVGKKRLASQNQVVGDGRNIQILNRQSSNKPALPQVSNRSRSSLEEKS